MILTLTYAKTTKFDFFFCFYVRACVTRDVKSLRIISDDECKQERRDEITGDGIKIEFDKRRSGKGT